MSDATYTYRDTDALIELQLAVFEVREGIIRLIVSVEDCDFCGDRVTAWLTLDEGRRMADAIENGKPFEATDPSGDVVTVEHDALQTTVSIVRRSFVLDGEEPTQIGIRLQGDAAVLVLAALRSLCSPAAEPGMSLAQQVEHLTVQLALASEFRVPLPDGLGGYGELVVRRESADSDRWAVTDGALAGLQAWAGDRWQYVTDVGRAATFVYSLDDALDMAEHVARVEQERHDARIRAAREGGAE
ncbi:hypothetical protein ACFWIK_00650 [Streptomyces anthocyanicus]|uniref:hypothetical protein n=1 Tax=Streptomyces anthocyanicus TaxID=68174 RepID=UPI003665722A